MMTSVLDREKVLVLNKNWQPVNTIPLRDAVTLLFGDNDGKPKARIVEPESYQAMTWEDWSELRPKTSDKKIRSAHLEFRVPEIIVLSKYDKIPKQRVQFSRRMVTKRDQGRCQYCGCFPKGDEATLDHIVPKCQGGLTTWENVVISCFKCNAKKAGKTPKQAGMKLLSQPKKPDMRYLHCDLTHKVDSWQAFLGECFWNVELQNDMDTKYYSEH